MGRFIGKNERTKYIFLAIIRKRDCMKLGPRKYFKMIAFDLDTNRLKDYYDDYTKAYKDIRHFMEQNGFTHRQGSVYDSIQKIDDGDIAFLCIDLKDTFEWTKDCIKSFNVTNIGHQYDMINTFRSDDRSHDFSMEADQISNYMEQDDDFDMEV